MKVRVIWAIASVVVVLVLAGCGGQTCPQQVNTSLGTIGTGQVFIVTGHSVYTPGDLIQASINNRLQVPIRIDNLGGTAFCPYFVLQVRAGNEWQDFYECVGGGGDAGMRNDPKNIEPGGSFTTGLRLHTDLPTGTYRLLLSYIMFPAPVGVTDFGTADSASFRICTCGVCA